LQKIFRHEFFWGCVFQMPKQRNTFAIWPGDITSLKYIANRLWIPWMKSHLKRNNRRSVNYFKPLNYISVIHVTLECLRQKWTEPSICSYLKVKRSNISNKKDCVWPHFQTPRRELTNFEVFGNEVKHCLECLIYLLSRN